MAPNDFPTELGKSFWDKKKGAVPAGSALETQLKTFEKKYQAVDWSLVEPGWEKKAKTGDALADAHASVDKAWRTKVMPLKMEATAVADVAQKLLKDKGLAKPTLDAVKAITDAAKTFGKLLDSGLDDIEKTHDKAAAVLKAGADGGGEQEEEASALLDPKQLLTQLNLCKRQPERRVGFAFVSDGKGEPMLIISGKATGKRLFAKLQAETAIKTGAFGRAWIIDNVMFLEMEKPFSGLVKKMRAPLRTVGFKVAKIVLASEDGTVLEADEEADAPDAAGDAASAAATAAAQTAAASAASATGAAAPKVQPGVAFTQTRLIWDQTRKKVQAELRKLESSILDTCKDESDLTEIAAGTKNLYEVLDHLDERLIDKLDEALNAQTPRERQTLHDEAREIVEEYVDFVDNEELMQDIDNNGFVGVAIKSSLTTSLNAIGQRLGA